MNSKLKAGSKSLVMIVMSILLLFSMSSQSIRVSAETGADLTAKESEGETVSTTYDEEAVDELEKGAYPYEPYLENQGSLEAKNLKGENEDREVKATSVTEETDQETESTELATEGANPEKDGTDSAKAEAGLETPQALAVRGDRGADVSKHIKIKEVKVYAKL